MSIAVISYDKKLLDSLPKINEIKTYDDTLSLVKDYQDDLKTIIYDSSSGVFAEDDLKYLISKLAGKNVRYFVLTVPENPINESSFSGNITFIPKSELSNFLPDIVKDIQQNKEEALNKHDIETSNQNTDSLINFEPDIISVKELTDEKDDLHAQFASEFMPEIEYGNIETEKELEGFENAWHTEFQSANLPIDENLLQNNYSDLNEFHFEGNKTEELQEFVKHREEEMEEKESITVEEFTETVTQKAEKTENNLMTETENKATVANFRISISSEDVKKLAMEMAKELLKNDNSLQTMIDHLQIDFQSEAMKELEEIKNQLKEAVRQQADAMVKQEIEKIIKDELRDQVEKITAKIVREKLDAIFKASG
ncbi:MAG: hypothetical protein JHC31_14465 [Sulfurihydrogenibium sp.]|nr:hypothetical protein [Sulfurihydrogenibium sp.]